MVVGERPSFIDPSKVTHDQIANLDQAYWDTMQQTRKRATDARLLTTGQLTAPIPQELVDAVDSVENFRCDTPFKYVEPLAIKQALIGSRPVIKRDPAGIGPRAMQAATTIEQACAAVLDRTDGGAVTGVPWDDVIDLTLIEGACALITMPVTASFESLPVMTDETGKLLSRYKIDRRGRVDTDHGYEGLNLSAASKRYTDEVDRYLAQNPLISYQAISIRDCVPIFGGSAAGNALRGLLVKQSYLESDLLEQGFAWDPTGTRGGLLTPTPAAGVGALGLPSGAPGAARILYSLWMTDHESGCPYVAYSVGGARTWRDGDSADDGSKVASCVNLKQRFGIERLPIAFTFGQAWSMGELDQKSVPYTQPFARSWLAVDTMMTGRIIHEWRFGLAGYFEQIADPQLAALLLDRNVPHQITARPMAVERVFGQITPNVPPPAARGMQDLAGFILGMTEHMTGSDVAGAKGADSGFAQTVAASYARDARRQVREGARRLYEAAGSFTLEALSGMAAKAGRSIDVVGNFPVPVSQAPSEQSPYRDVIHVTEQLCSGDYTVTAEFKSEFGDNLAVQQQAAEFVDRRLKPRRWFHELTGESSPEVVEAEILSDQMLLSEQGIADTMALVAKIQGDRDKAAELELQVAGQVGPDGLPSGLMDEMQGMAPPGMPPNGAPPLTGAGTSAAQSSLAGAIGGALMAGPAQQVGQAGAPLPALPAPGAVPGM